MNKIIFIRIVISFLCLFLISCSTTSKVVGKYPINNFIETHENKFIKNGFNIIRHEGTEYTIQLLEYLSKSKNCSKIRTTLIKKTKIYFLPNTSGIWLSMFDDRVNTHFYYSIDGKTKEINKKKDNDPSKMPFWAQLYGAILFFPVPIVGDIFCMIGGYHIIYERNADTTIIECENNLNKSPITNEFISAYLNGIHCNNIKTNNKGIAQINFGNHSITTNSKNNLKVSFKYKNTSHVIEIPYDVYKSSIKLRAKPCDLTTEFIGLNESESHNPNGAIDAAEKLYAELKIINSGKGTAFNVIFFVETDSRFLSLPKKISVGDMPSDTSKIIKVPLESDVNLPSGKLSLNFFAKDDRDFASNTVVRKIETLPIIPSSLNILSYHIIDGKIGRAQGNGNGIPENGETFELEVSVINNGKGIAKNVTLNIHESGTNTKLIQGSVIIGNINPGKTSTGRLVVSLDRVYNSTTFKPLVTVEEKFALDKLDKRLIIPVRLKKPVLTLESAISDEIGYIKNGDTAFTNIFIFNRSDMLAKNVHMNLSINEIGPSILEKQRISLGDIPPNSKSNIQRVKVIIPRTYQEKGITINVKLTQDEFKPVEDFIVIRIVPSRPHLFISWKVKDNMINNKIQMGKAAQLTASIENKGGISAEGVFLKIRSYEKLINPFFQNGNKEVALFSIPVNGRVDKDFWIQAKKFNNSKPGKYQIDISVTQKDFPSTNQKISFSTVDSKDFKELLATASEDNTNIKSYVSPPMVRITYPFSGSIFYQDNIMLQGYIDDDKGISRTEIWLNGEIISKEGQRGIRVRHDNRILVSKKIILKSGVNNIKIIAWDTDNAKNVDSVDVNKSEEKSRIWAAIIGINNYKNSKIPDLNFALSDATSMNDYIQNDLKVPSSNILSLYNENATKQNIEKILGDFLPRKAKKQDTVIIYYSGHGAPYQNLSSPDGDNVSKYLLTFDTEPESMWATALAMERIREIFQRIKSERVVFLADTCYSGASGGKSLSINFKSHFNDNFLDRLAEGRGRVIITASGAGELAREDKELGGGHGVFTYYLLEGLKGLADQNGDKLITSGEVYEYVSVMVSKHTNNEQHPVKKGEEEKPIILGIIPQ